MQRRALLATLGAAAGAGCAGGLGAPWSSDSETAFRLGDLAVSTRKVAPTTRYEVAVTAAASEAALADDPANHTVVALSDVEDPAVREVLEDAIRDDRLRRDEVPAGLPELTERVDYFTWGLENRPADATSHWGVTVHRLHPARGPVVLLEATVADRTVAPGDPGVVTFALTNVGRRPRSVRSRGVAPLGVLEAEGPDRQVLLWHDYDEAADCVTVGPDGTATASCPTATTIVPGETVTARYDLRHSPPAGSGLAAGDYVVADRLAYKRASDGDSTRPLTEVEWEVAFSVAAV